MGKPLEVVISELAGPHRTVNEIITSLGILRATYCLDYIPFKTNQEIAEFICDGSTACA